MGYKIHLKKSQKKPVYFCHAEYIFQLSIAISIGIIWQKPKLGMKCKEAIP